MIRRPRSLLPSFLLLAALTAADCRPEGPPPPPPPLWDSRELKIEINKRSLVDVSIYTPRGVPLKAEVLVLPGWKHERHRWLRDTKILKYARAHGFRLILPEMNVSIYASEYFPETKRKWAPVPGLVFVTDYLFPQLQKAGYFTGRHAATQPAAAGETPPAQTTPAPRGALPRLLLGLSTGGRGVLQIGLARPKMFQAAAALSGDYDQTRQPKDRLMTAVYGPYEDYQERWERIDNPIYAIDGWRIPLYIAHGTKDRIVPVAESRVLHETLRATHPNLKVEFETPAMGHDYAFWDEYTRRAFLFFDQILTPSRTGTTQSTNQGT